MRPDLQNETKQVLESCLYYFYYRSEVLIFPWHPQPVPNDELKMLEKVAYVLGKIEKEED